LKYQSDRHGKIRALLDRGADYVASFGDDWFDAEGASLRDPALFTRVPLNCRGLFRVNRDAVRAALARLDQQDQKATAGAATPAASGR